MNISEKTKESIASYAKMHVKRVTENPDVETDADNFDYWNTTQDDQSKALIDYNVYFNDEEWSCCAYSVDSPTKDNPYYQVDTNDYELIKLI